MVWGGEQSPPSRTWTAPAPVTAHIPCAIHCAMTPHAMIMTHHDVRHDLGATASGASQPPPSRPTTLNHTPLAHAACLCSA